MTLLPLTDCCERLSVDPKTLRKSGQARGDASACPSDRRSGQMPDHVASPATGWPARANPPATPAAPERARRSDLCLWGAKTAHRARTGRRPLADADGLAGMPIRS
jgi:hypothetical protein